LQAAGLNWIHSCLVMVGDVRLRPILSV
jgi:hypothetical protein